MCWVLLWNPNGWELDACTWVESFEKSGIDVETVFWVGNIIVLFLDEENASLGFYYPKMFLLTSVVRWSV